jgi:ABC-type sugar transport system substrate-binding protein
VDRPGPKLCHLHINEPDQIFDKGLKAEAERVAEELTRGGFPIRVELRYGRGDEKNQLQQIEADRRAPAPPDLFIVIPVNKDAVHEILSGIVRTRDDVTCVLLHQPLTRMQNAEREAYGRRLFSVAADQREIGRIQARQLAAVLPAGGGDVLYVQGRQNSFATAQRMLGLLEELPRTGGVKLNGYRVYGDWSPQSVRTAVENWTRLGGKLEWLGAAGAQSDDMALALAAHLGEQGRPMPVIGVDGLETGKRAVNAGTLAATVVQPLGVGHALRVYRDLVTGAPGGEPVAEDGNIVLPPESYPSLDELRRRSNRAS